LFLHHQLFASQLPSFPRPFCCIILRTDRHVFGLIIVVNSLRELTNAAKNRAVAHEYVN
jgi:hypothetical protein